MADGSRDETDAPATVDLGPGGGARDPAAPVAPRSAFDREGPRFERVGELGRGGMGRVDDAFDRSLGRPVAIKHMLACGDVDLARFEREAKITARLEHPGIVPIHDAGRGSDGTPYYVMRRIDGRPLAELVAGKQQLAQRLELLPHVLTACEAAAYAHARSIVHRDIKPTNILIGPFGESLLIDWGLAREIGETRVDAPLPPSDPQLTRVGTVAGTPGFMAPEQARGEHVDARADVFALGATLFYVLAGKPPYASDSATEMIGLAGAGRPPDWRALPPQVPPDLLAIVQKAMASDAAARYGDASALAADLRQFLVGNLVGAYRYGTRARLARFVRRHRAAVAVAVVSAIVLAVVATLSVRRIVAERDGANDARAVAEARQRDAMAAADRLLLQRAQEQLDTDPTLAVQLLRQLPPDSPLWPQAAPVAQAAALVGIPFGFSGSPSDMTAMSLDGRLAATIDTRRFDATVIDLVARTKRSLGTFDGAHFVEWLDVRHIVLVTRTELIEVDVDSGASRRRTLPADSEVIVVARDGSIWDTARDRTYTAASFDAPFAVAYDESLNASDDLVMFGSRGGPHAVIGSHVTPLAIGFADYTLVAVHGGVAAISTTHIAAWRRRGDELVKLGEWQVERPLFAEIVGDRVYAATFAGLISCDARGVHHLLPTLCASPTRASVAERAAFGCNDGSIVVIEPAGWWWIPPRRVEYGLMQLGSDGRFLLARTKAGALLVWDLPTFAPALHHLGPHERAAAVAGGTLWSLAVPSDLIAYDLATWQRRVVPGNPYALVGGVFGDPAGRALVIDELVPTASNSDVLIVVDAKTGTQLGVLERGEVLQVGDDGTYVARRNGAIERWTTGTAIAKHVLFTLDAQPGDVAERRGIVAASVHDHELVRLDTATGAMQRTHLAAAIERLAVGNDGRVWAASDRTVWSWDGRSEPRALEVGDKIDLMFTSRDHLVLGTSSSVVLPDLATPTTVSLGTSRDVIGSPASTWLAARSSEGVALLDVTTGRTLHLSFAYTPTSIYVTAHDLVVTTDSNSFAEQLVFRYELAVPTEPAALQRWLADVTNARMMPGNEASVWP